ncbi:hypothetical protein DDZ13_10290 [Coraliomargarita sinensis]|uniref:Uncharacterized protein n=2 Tax=Coraliomargarita sinensis TaxID=2174842 RepID=A0A317ZE61_9BACT|nr:hypothetical protein DDZ13_10290 [Coraliomargarita sinensis]
MIGAIGFLFCLFMEPGVGAVTLATASSAAISTGCFILTLRLEREFIAYKALVLYFVLQPFFLLTTLLSYPVALQEKLAYSGIFDVRPIGIFFSYSLIPFLGLLFAFILVATRGQGIKRNLAFYMQIAKGKLDILLIFAAFINFTIWITTVYGGPLTYFLRILHKSLSISAFFGGLYIKRSKYVTIAWAVSLGVGLVLSFFTGSRGYAFFPLAFYGIGVLVQARGGKERRLWIVAALVSIPIVLLSVGLIQNLRSELGRKQITEVNLEEFMTYAGNVVAKSFKAEEVSHLGREDSPVWHGMTRLIDWTTLLAPTMTPRESDYRGYGDFLQEIRGQFVWAGFGRSEGRFYASRLFARMYGFNVYYQRDYSGKIQSYTVPFNILADSWSRLGIISTCMQVGIAFIFFTVLELFNRKLFKNYPSLIVMGIIILLSMSFKHLTTYTLLETIRGTILQYCFTMLMLYLVLQFFRIIPLGGLDVRAPRG